MHLFAGAGGGLLSDLILGHTPIVAVEWDKYCCKVLRERAADGWFPELSVWEGDVRLFDPSEYAGRVDTIHAGFPCQDLSLAGKRSGLGEGTRSGLYREVMRIAGIIRPKYIFLENVSAILSNGLECVLADLVALGYDCRWTCLRASDCGAPHLRDRWWCLAVHSDSTIKSAESAVYQRRRQSKDAKSGGVCEDVAHPNSIERRAGIVGQNRQTNRRDYACGSGESVSHPNGEHEQRIVYKLADEKRREDSGERSTGPLCDEFGWWKVEPRMGRVVDGMAHRLHRLKALGNGQVPLQAAVAWRLLGGPIG